MLISAHILALNTFFHSQIKKHQPTVEQLKWCKDNGRAMFGQGAAQMEDTHEWLRGLPRKHFLLRTTYCRKKNAHFRFQEGHLDPYQPNVT